MFLSKLGVMGLEVPEILQPMLDCLEMFRLVVEGCFSWDMVPDFQERIQAFTLDYSSLVNYAKVLLYYCYQLNLTTDLTS